VRAAGAHRAGHGPRAWRGAAPLSRVLLFSCTAALYPTLLAATTAMLLLPDPKRLLLGYLLGAMMTSVTLGLLIVFALDGSSAATSTARHTLNPVVDIVLGGLVLVIAFVVATGRDTRRRARSERRRAAQADKGPPRWKQALSAGGARTTFVIGALLTLPGTSYLAALTATAKQDLSDVATVLTVLGINVIMLALLEIPLIGYTLSPEKTAAMTARLGAWLSRDGGKVALVVAVVLALALVGRGIAGLIS
jgi:Sap-like sulfolipid-1-addressing protein